MVKNPLICVLGTWQIWAKKGTGVHPSPHTWTMSLLYHFFTLELPLIPASYEFWCSHSQTPKNHENRTISHLSLYILLLSIRIMLTSDIFNLQNIEHWKIPLNMNTKRKLSHKPHFFCGAADCTRVAKCHGYGRYICVNILDDPPNWNLEVLLESARSMWSLDRFF